MANEMNEPNRADLFIVPDGKSKIDQRADTKAPNASLFVIEREDHTLGNLLRAQLDKNSQVMFSGYRVNHPLEHRIELRVECTPDSTPQRALVDACSELKTQITALKTDLVSFWYSFPLFTHEFRKDPWLELNNLQKDVHFKAPVAIKLL